MEITAEELEITAKAAAEAAKEAVRERDGARDEAAQGVENYQVLEDELQDAKKAKEELEQDLRKLTDRFEKTRNLLKERSKRLRQQRVHSNDDQGAVPLTIDGLQIPISRSTIPPQLYRSLSARPRATKRGTDHILQPSSGLA